MYGLSGWRLCSWISSSTVCWGITTVRMEYRVLGRSLSAHRCGPGRICSQRSCACPSQGQSRGELLALLWTDLDLDRHTISVSKSVLGRNGELKVSAPKTRHSIRTVVIPQQAVDLLIQEHELHPDNPYMFPSPVTGTMYHPDAAGRIHRKLLKEAGIESVRFHDLRHTFATLALQNGVDIKTLSGMLGHYSSGFTLDTYTHITDKMQQEAAEKVGSFMEMTF